MEINDILLTFGLNVQMSNPVFFDLARRAWIVSKNRCCGSLTWNDG